MSGIVLLCTAHHREASNGIVSKETVREWRKEPRAKLHGVAGWTPAHVVWPGIVLGTDTFHACTALHIPGVELEVEEPEVKGQPARISLKIYDPEDQSRVAFHMNRNELVIGRGNYDVQFEGSRLKVQEVKAGHAIELDFANQELVLRKLQRKGAGISLRVVGDWTIYSTPKDIKVTVRERIPMVSEKGGQIRHVDPHFRGPAVVEFINSTDCTVSGDITSGGAGVHVGEGSSVSVENCNLTTAGPSITMESGARVQSRNSNYRKLKRGPDPGTPD